jgi:Tol biopolymer transport system component
MIGERLGSYEVTAKLGEGGMGEVYRATDTRLKRDVAIKVLPPAFTQDPERLARFEREAQLLAQLHHPNIASIFGLEESQGVRALVMELVGGPTLAERLERGPLPLEESLSLARQIAEALEAAHEKGIVHRDLKPQNVKLTPEGKVKVLDFGLAKAMDPLAAGSGAPTAAAASPTLTLGATVQGLILGTAAYMAPEQAKGLPVDKRADVWAFGVVLYEMLAGARLFAGDSVPDTLAGVLKNEIDFAALPREVPPAIRRLLRRCLERNPKNRLHDVADARIVLDEVATGRSDETSAVAAPAGRDSGRTRWPLAAGGLVAGALLGALAVGLLRGGAPAGVGPELSQLSILAPEGTSIQRGLAISPDGGRIAFTARDAEGLDSLWVRELGSLEARELAGTAGARLPFWAPDGRRIGFFSDRSVKWTDSAGGSPNVLAQTATVADVRGGAWGADDTILYAPTFTGPLFAVSAQGGPSAPATRLPEGGAIGTTRFPCFLPDGRRFVYYASAGTGTEPGELWLGRLGSLEAKRLASASSMAIYAEPGYLLFARGESLVAQRFDAAAEQLVGAPEILGLPMGGSLAVSGLRSIAAGAGTMVYRNDKRNASQLVWVDRAGRELESLSDRESAWNYLPQLSPDGRYLLTARYELASVGLGQIWVHDLTRKLTTRVTFDEGDDFIHTWLPTGRGEFLYSSLRPGARGNIYRATIDRPGEERLWLAGDVSQYPLAVTPDGRRVVFVSDEVFGLPQLWIRDLEGERAPIRLSGENAAENAADISPDGRWLAYASNATRGWEVYARPLDGAGAVVRISIEGGNHPRWRRDGRELFYVDAGGRLIAVPMTVSGPAPGAPDGRLEPGAPQVLFQARLEEASDRQFDVVADGQRFVLNRSVANEGVPIVVAQGWTALLERRDAERR